MKPIKLILVKLLPKSLIDALSSVKLILSGDYMAVRRRLQDNERSTSLLALYMMMQRENTEHHFQRNIINQYECRVYSQNGEDGILFYLFSLLGTTDRRFVEFGIGDGKQCNTANFSLNFGWSGLLIEADQRKAKAAQLHYERSAKNIAGHVEIVPARVTKENINALLKENNFVGEIDLLSIDIDGNDYWVWQAIKVIQPRVVVIEYNASFGPTKAITVPYEANFDRFSKHPLGYFHGASLKALAMLANKKGYILVGCDTSGTNALFVRNDIARDKIDPVSVADAYYPSFTRSASFSQNEQFEMIANMPFVEVQVGLYDETET